MQLPALHSEDGVIAVRSAVAPAAGAALLATFTDIKTYADGSCSAAGDGYRPLCQRGLTHIVKKRYMILPLTIHLALRACRAKGGKSGRLQ